MKTLAIDFDGVIHAYSRGWEDGSIYDEPVPGVADALAGLSRYFRLVIFTARDSPDLPKIRKWLAAEGLDEHISEVTNRKPKAWAYIDDRAIRFESWGQALDTLAALEPGDAWREHLDSATYHHEETDGTLGSDPGGAS
jgi:hypothetical protein